MNFDEYQKAAMTTAIYPSVKELVVLALRRKNLDDEAAALEKTQLPDVDGNVFYAALGLGEVGEVQNKVKKIMRDAGGVITDEMREVVGKELGDALWYIAGTCTEMGLSMEEVAEGNISKLLSRKVRGQLTGNGDDR